MVQQEEQHQKGSNSSSGGGSVAGGGGVGGSRSSKKPKEKKIPQRGLGVAQLEKIRLEEQKKDSASALASSSCFVVPLSHHHLSASSIPFPPPSPIDLSFRPTPSIPISNFDLFGLPPLPTTTTATLYGHTGSYPPSAGGGGGGGGGGGVSPIIGSIGSVPGQHSYFPSIWNPHECSHDREDLMLDPGLQFPPHLQNESNPIWLPYLVTERKKQHQHHHQQQQPQLPLSVVNVTPATSSSSGLNLQMEPPSNQSCYSNYTPHLWPEEEKVVGMKRSWPFSLDNPPSNSFPPCKFPPFIPSIFGPNGASSCGSGGRFNFDPGNPILRDVPSSSTAIHGDWRVPSSSELNTRKAIKEGQDLGGDFLTLGPPVSTSSSLTTSKAKQPSAFSASYYGGFPEFELPSFQGIMEDPVQQQQPLHSFFPQNAQNGRAPTMNDRRGEAGDIVDLNLRL